MCAAAKNKRRDADWFNLEDAARVFGVTQKGFDKHIRPLIPDDAIEAEGKGHSTWVYMRAAIDAYAAKEVAKAVARAAVTPASNGNGTSSGDDKAELTAIKVQTARFNLEKMCGEWVKVSEMQRMIALWSAILRRGGETIRRLHGDGPYKVHEKALADAARQLDVVHGHQMEMEFEDDDGIGDG